jgi:predicted Zn-dependent protease with MMP-like domain
MTTSESSGYDLLNETEWDRVQRVWTKIEDGEIEAARIDLDPLLSQRPGHPDLRIVEAALLLEEAEPARALDTLRGAERSADPALFFHLRALCAYELARFEAARDDAERALAIRSELPETHDLLSRIHDHLGDAEGARRHAVEARVLDSEGFPEPLAVPDDEFDRIVERSLSELPAEVRKHLEDLPVIVEPLPRRELLTAEQPPLTPDLLGLFIGTHLLERSHSDPPSSPGAIYLFRRNLLRSVLDVDELAEEIRTTVRHEVGHLLGLDEDDLEEWGLA